MDKQPPSEPAPAADRRTFLVSLGVAAATATFGSFEAFAASGAPAVALPAEPVPAVFWNLGYMDYTGTAEPAVIRRRRDLSIERDRADPHAELLGR